MLRHQLDLCVLSVSVVVYSFQKLIRPTEGSGWMVMKSSDFPLIDVEAHLFPSLKHIDYFPGFKLVKSKTAPKRSYANWGLSDIDAAYLLKLMDQHGVDYSCILPEKFLSTTDGHIPWSTNGYIVEQAAKSPGRLIPQANVGPILTIGVEKACWELEHLVKEKGFRLVKVYQPEDIGPLNDPRMWPFYEKVAELKIPMTIHTGMSFVAGQYSKYCHPLQLEEIATSFPEVPIIAFHVGFPYVDELSWLSAIYKNIYVGTSYILGSKWLDSSPRWAGIILGKIKMFATPSKLIWGTDFSGNAEEYEECVNFVKNFQIPEAVQREYGYEPITDEDRRKWGAENLAKLLGLRIEKKVRKA